MKSQIETRHTGFTLVELLVVVFIIAMLVAIMTPAIQMARESARKASCQANLRQFGVAFQVRTDLHGTYCSGATDWSRDGSVVDTGWVADMVNQKIPTGEMLCPSNPLRMMDAYSDLLTLNTFTSCVDMKGSERSTLPDGKLAINPCRTVVENITDPGNFPPVAQLDFVPSSGTTDYNAGTEDRRELMQKYIYEEHYNTNYTASWFLVRSNLSLDKDGNLTQQSPGCGVGVSKRNSTAGPLTVQIVSAAAEPSSFIPLMADGGAGLNMLPQAIGEEMPGTMLVAPYTPGPVENPGMTVPAAFPAGTDKSTWWPVWARGTRQDFRAFSPVHAGYCNILFADGSVRAFKDLNGDGLMNNGFAPTPTNGFGDDTIDLPDDKVDSFYSLIDGHAHK